MLLHVVLIGYVTTFLLFQSLDTYLYYSYTSYHPQAFSKIILICWLCLLPYVNRMPFFYLAPM
jgi:hypothetical protein